MLEKEGRNGGRERRDIEWRRRGRRRQQRHIVSTFVHLTMYPWYNYNMLISKRKENSSVYSIVPLITWKLVFGQA
jgi:hypothetical protein